MSQHQGTEWEVEQPGFLRQSCVIVLSICNWHSIWLKSGAILRTSRFWFRCMTCPIRIFSGLLRESWKHQLMQQRLDCNSAWSGIISARGSTEFDGMNYWISECKKIEGVSAKDPGILVFVMSFRLLYKYSYYICLKSQHLVCNHFHPKHIYSLILQPCTNV